MSLFGKWECPNCGSTWTGSIGWDFTLLDDQERLDRLLQTGCGCEPVDKPEYPRMSASCMGFEPSEKRKQLMEEREKVSDDASENSG